MPGAHIPQPIPIEALSEYDVQNILLDGREILVKPETPAEHFQHILNQIDFKKSYSDVDSVKAEDRESQLKSHDVSLKLWTHVRDAMRMALVEINAFTDILSVLKEGKYLSVFPVASEPPEASISLVLAGKKKAFTTAAAILLKGSAVLRQRHLEVTDARSKTSSCLNYEIDSTHPQVSFQETLITLRQEWRIKLHQNSIIGDVSLRSIGSHFRQPGNFEIREADLIKRNVTNSTKANCATEVVFSRSVEAMMNSTVGSGLLNVRIHEAGVNAGPSILWSCVFSEAVKDNFNANPVYHDIDDAIQCDGQREQLVQAQRVLACREILHILSCEASGLRESSYSTFDNLAFSTPDEVIAALFPGVQLSISMLASRPQPPSAEDTELASGSVGTWANSRLRSQLSALGLQLHRLLANRHRHAWPNMASTPQPTAGGPVQVPARLRAAGARGLACPDFTGGNGSGGRASVNLEVVGNFSISVASVAGFAGPAASAWSTMLVACRAPKGNLAVATGAGPAGGGRLPSVAVGQERLALFTEWGSPPSTIANAARPAHGQQHLPSCNNQADALRLGLFDDSVAGTSGVAAMEQMLTRRGVDEPALRSVFGADNSLLEQTVAIARHCYLREKVFTCLALFARTCPIRMIAHWASINSAVSTSVRLCFYASGFDAFRSWLSITISPTGVAVYHSDPPVVRQLGLDLTVGLRSILENQVLLTQVHFVELLSTRILGWTRLGNNSCSAYANCEEVDTGSMVTKLLSSPSGKHCVCLRASLSTGIRLFVASASGDSFGVHSIPSEAFREVNLDAIPLRPHALARIEAVMTTLI